MREFDSKRFIPVEQAGDADQRLCEISVDAQVTPGIGVRQSAARHRTLEAHVIQFASLCTQTRLDVTQTLPPCQLREGHRQVLFATRERLHFMMTVVLRNARLERPAWQELHELREHCLAFVHPIGPPSLMKKDTNHTARTSSRVRPRSRASLRTKICYKDASRKRPDTTELTRRRFGWHGPLQNNIDMIYLAAGRLQCELVS